MALYYRTFYQLEADSPGFITVPFEALRVGQPRRRKSASDCNGRMRMLLGNTDIHGCLHDR
jgi:hypothetical protein